jgi:hypothetical protein
MALTRSFIRNAATTPLDARLMDMAKVVANADGSPRVGVLGGANPSIVSTTATMNVTIAAAEFVTSKGKADGVSIFTNDGTVNVPIATAPASNSRIDVIYVKHNDNTTGDADSNPIFAVAQGTAAASPTKPAIPTGALELATLRVYAGTTATNGGSNTLTNTYQMTAMRGGRVHFRTRVELEAWATAVIGQDAYAQDNPGWGFIYANSSWLVTNAPPTMGTIGSDGNATMTNMRCARGSDGYVDIKGQGNRINGTTYAGQLIIGVVPVGFRPQQDSVADVLTYGSGSVNTATVFMTNGFITLNAPSPAGHTIARFQSRYYGAP